MGVGGAADQRDREIVGFVLYFEGAARVSCSINRQFMRKLVASAWVTLDNVFDSALMPQWFFPYDSKSRQQAIRESVMGSGAILMGRTTYEMLMPYWSALRDSEMDGIAGQLNGSPKYIVSARLGAAT